MKTWNILENGKPLYRVNTGKNATAEQAVETWIKDTNFSSPGVVRQDKTYTAVAFVDSRLNYFGI